MAIVTASTAGIGLGIVRRLASEVGSYARHAHFAGDICLATLAPECTLLLLAPLDRGHAVHHLIHAGRTSGRVQPQAAERG